MAEPAPEPGRSAAGTWSSARVPGQLSSPYADAAAADVDVLEVRA